MTGGELRILGRWRDKGKHEAHLASGVSHSLQSLWKSQRAGKGTGLHSCTSPEPRLPYLVHSHFELQGLWGEGKRIIKLARDGAEASAGGPLVLLPTAFPTVLGAHDTLHSCKR